MAEQRPELSFVIPCHNEEGNLRPLVQAIKNKMVSLNTTYEVIINDDASTDHSWVVLKEIAQSDPCCRVQRFKDNCGESAAIWAGMINARGRFIVTIAADLQNDLDDLPKFLEALEFYDCVCGTRVAARRKGDSWIRVVSSRVANSVRNKMLGENISDAGCSYRAFRRDCISKIKFFRGAHRYLPTLVEMEGFTVTEIFVKNNPRFSGKSHYGIRNRLLGAVVDLLGMWWIKFRSIHYEIVEKIN
jgi:glycosyltransferase involved in cell wall biosynthesis